MSVCLYSGVHVSTCSTVHLWRSEDILCVCLYSDVYVSTCSTVHVRKSEDTFRSCVFLSHHTVGPGV